jgi:hypothetical protein
MSDTTNIFDLPTDPAGGGNFKNNINLSASENVVIQQQQHLQQQQQQLQQQSISPPNGGVSLDQGTISQIVNGLQQAAITGATQLPSRDIPMTTSGIVNDPQIQPNYVPQVPQDQNDYIQNYESTDDIISDYNRKVNNSNSLDEMYNEIQTPILLMVMYFLFQLPFFKRFLFTYLPILFSKDGNLNINGFLFTSILFGLIFYLLNKITTHFSKF